MKNGFDPSAWTWAVAYSDTEGVYGVFALFFNQHDANLFFEALVDKRGIEVRRNKVEGE